MSDIGTIGYDAIFRAPPFLLAAVYLAVFVALTIVQALVARQRGSARWWDFLTVSMVGFFAGWAFYAGALGGNYAGWAEPTPDYFTVNRAWIGVSAAIGLPVALLALWRGVRELTTLVRDPPPRVRTEPTQDHIGEETSR